jgi:hypothetical protein
MPATIDDPEILEEITDAFKKMASAAFRSFIDVNKDSPDHPCVFWVR